MSWLAVASICAQVVLIAWIGLTLARIRRKLALLLDEPEQPDEQPAPADADEPLPESPRVHPAPPEPAQPSRPAPPVGSARARAARRPL